MDIPQVWYDQPIYYKCNRFSVVGTGHDVRWPLNSKMLDYELEFGIFLGKGGVNMTKQNARSHIFGYCIFNESRRKALVEIKRWLHEVNIVPSGRYGLWTYFWSDEAIQSGKDSAELAQRHLEVLSANSAVAASS